MDVDQPFASSSTSRSNVLDIPETPIDPNPQQPFDYRSVRDQDPVICIDNGELTLNLTWQSVLWFSYDRRGHSHESCDLTGVGSHSWRAGFSTMSTPYIDRLNVVARFKERKQGRNIALIGKDTEVEANARSNARSMFDGDLLIHSEILVCLAKRCFKAGCLSIPKEGAHRR